MSYSFEALSVLSKAGLVDLRKELETRSPNKITFRNTITAQCKTLAKGHKGSRTLSQGSSRAFGFSRDFEQKPKDSREDFLRTCLNRLKSKTNRSIFPTATINPDCIGFGVGEDKRQKDKEIIAKSEYLRYLYYTYEKAKAKASKHVAMLKFIKRNNSPAKGKVNETAKIEPIKKQKVRPRLVTTRYSQFREKKNTDTTNVIEQSKLFWKTLKDPALLEPFKTVNVKPLRPLQRVNNKVIKVGPTTTKPVKVTLFINPTVVPKIMNRWGPHMKLLP